MKQSVMCSNQLDTSSNLSFAVLSRVLCCVFEGEWPFITSNFQVNLTIFIDRTARICCLYLYVGEVDIMKGSNKRRVFPTLVFDPPAVLRNPRTPNCRNRIVVESFPLMCVNAAGRDNLSEKLDKGSRFYVVMLR